MILQSMFSYPACIHVRLHGPAGYANYQDYKPFLRDEFEFRCVYCLTRERWSDSGADTFGIDHFVAKQNAPELTVEYGNLVYACNRCNSIKRTQALLINPCSHIMSNHLSVDDSGEVVGTSPEGKSLVGALRLNSPNRKRFRADKLLVEEAAELDPENEFVKEMLARFRSYPVDLPDLTPFKPPGGNAKPDGIKVSHHARRSAGSLPDFY